jgi:HlyD family secretion protein
VGHSPAIALIGINSVYPKQTNIQTISIPQKPKRQFPLLMLLLGLGLPLTGCEILPKAEAEAQRPPSAQGGNSITSVDVATAQPGILKEPLEYIGTTSPIRLVSLRAQTEGRLLNLQVGIGDIVKQGQILARLDDAILLTGVTQEKAELAALQAEVARAQTQVKNAEALAQQAKAEQQQAQVDAQRWKSLQASGAAPARQAELAQTAAQTAQQKYNAAVSQIATEQQAVVAAQGRVAAQNASVAQTKERQSYAQLASPITGVVLEQVSEPGNLIQPGGEVLRLGDFSSVKIVVPVSELELSKIRVGQAVTVKLDAFAKETFSGQVSRISPAADQAARQVPIEITIPNSNGKIGSGLLARVSFATNSAEKIIIPQTALQGEADPSRATNQTQSKASNLAQNTPQSPSQGTVFVVAETSGKATVKSRNVKLGTRENGKVEIISGLQPGERLVVRSAKPLKDGETVRLSVLSKTAAKQEKN